MPLPTTALPFLTAVTKRDAKREAAALVLAKILEQAPKTEAAAEIQQRYQSFTGSQSQAQSQAQAEAVAKLPWQERPAGIEERAERERIVGEMAEGKAIEVTDVKDESDLAAVYMQWRKSPSQEMLFRKGKLQNSYLELLRNTAQSTGLSW